MQKTLKHRKRYYMENITITKDMTATKAKALAKRTMTEKFIDFLIKELGEENVKMVRTASAKNVLAARIGTVIDGAEEYSMCVTIDISAKDFKDRITSKKTFEAFDFDFSAEEYERYLDEKGEKAAEKARLKEEKIKRDEKARTEKE